MRLGAVAILPKKQYWQVSKIKAGIDKGLDKTADKAQSALRKTSATFSRPPDFVITSKPYEREISTSDQKYLWVDDGTKPHLIAARNYRQLFFNRGSSPKTSPGALEAGAGSPGVMAPGPKVVRHPGTKPRGFSKALAKLFVRILKNNIEAEIDPYV